MSVKRIYLLELEEKGQFVTLKLTELIVCGQVTVFEQEHFQGKCLEFTSECCNIQECGLDNIRSIRVESGA